MKCLFSLAGTTCGTQATRRGPNNEPLCFVHQFYTDTLNQTSPNDPFFFTQGSAYTPPQAPAPAERSSSQPTSSSSSQPLALRPAPPPASRPAPPPPAPRPALRPSSLHDTLAPFSSSAIQELFSATLSAAPPNPPTPARYQYAATQIAFADPSAPAQSPHLLSPPPPPLSQPRAPTSEQQQPAPLYPQPYSSIPPPVNSQNLLGASSDIGHRSYMEDFCGAWMIDVCNPCCFGPCSIGVIFDGHNGRKCAEFLSQHAVRIFHEAFNDVSYQTFRRQTVVECMLFFVKTLSAMWDEESIPVGEVSGSTLLLGIFNQHTREKYMAHVGDSRGVAFSEDGEVLFETKDHKLEDPEEAKSVRERNRVMQENTSGERSITITKGRNGCSRLGLNDHGVLAMSRSIGDNSLKLMGAPLRKPDLWETSGNQMERCVLALKPCPEEWEPMKAACSGLVLASDGVWDVLTSRQVARIVAAGRSAGKTAEVISGDILQTVWRKNDPSHALDNLSCVVLL